MDTNGWAALEVRHLAAFVAVADAGTFGAAAGRLGYTQAAVSQQIAALERIVGLTLLDRAPGRRPYGLTPAGHALHRHALAVLARVRSAQADLAALEGERAGTLRIGTYASVGARILPDVTRAFLAAWPDIEIHLTDGAGDQELLPLVESGELDISFAMLPVEDGPFEVFEVLRDPYVLVVQRDSGLPDRLGPEDLVGLPLIGFRTCRHAARVEAQLSAHGVEPNTVFRSDDNGTVQGLVAAGIGHGLIPRLAADPADPRTRIIPVDGLAPRRLGIVRHRDRRVTPATRAYIELAREHCATLD
ncbi:MAG TPA: LysR family transcriptional regulator [Micromonosporaceae bacterium]|jgi:DNA-binding transcriptional LysR family regulator